MLNRRAREEASMGWIDQRGSEVLSRNECLRLLALRAGGVGRLGLVVDGAVVIEPVNYRLLDGEEQDVLIQVGPGSILDAARREEVVAFEVDELDPDAGHAWSVLVRGVATVVAPAVAAHARPPDARPLVPEPGLSFVRIRTGVVTGRRFTLRR
jgi:nitroimidazol reductase NimA-like FMN-containing flavoprotein (pyridoxamine 5'-phosphate oxidase superfamily)